MALLLAIPTARSHGAEQPVMPTDLLRLRTIPHIDVSRDGRVGVWVVRSCTPGEWRGDAATYAYRSNLWTADLRGDAPVPRQLTFGIDLDTVPTLSPDGLRIAFIRAPGPGAPGQLHVMDLAGGEARAITDLPRGATAPRWSPDGTMIVFVSPVPLAEMPSAPPWPLERPRRTWNDEPLTGTMDAPPVRSPSPDGSRAERREWLAIRAAAGDPQVITRLEFVEDRGLTSSMSFQHLFVVDADGGSAPRRVTTAFADHEEPTFTNDGQRIVFVTPARGAAMHPDRVVATELWSVRLDGADERAILRQEGWSYSDPQPSRDGTAMAFRARQIDELAFRPWLLGMVETASLRPESQPDRDDQRAIDPTPILLSESLDRSIHRFAWLGTGGLLFTLLDRGGIPLLALHPASPATIDIARSAHDAPVGVYAFGAGGGLILFARTTPSVPAELVLRDARGERVLMDLNPWVRERWLSMPQERWIDRPDGTRIQAWIMEPRRVRRTERHPLLLLIHGGPNGMWGPGELTMWHEMQVLCGAGFGIVYANPRGSGGYGYAFERANRQDWGPGPGGDVLAAVDAAMSMDWVDHDRLAVAGGSYGGFLTAWLITRDTRFKAAIADRGVYDFDTFFGEASAWRLLERSFGGNPYDARIREVIERHSPVLDARRIRTPLLIIHGSADRRTGYVQSEMLYRALKSLDRPVEYVRYPGADHDLSRRGELRQRLDRIVRNIEFLDRYVGP